MYINNQTYLGRHHIPEGQPRLGVHVGPVVQQPQVHPIGNDDRNSDFKIEKLWCSKRQVRVSGLCDLGSSKIFIMNTLMQGNYSLSLC